MAGWQLRGLGPDTRKGARVHVGSICEPTLVMASVTGGFTATSTWRQMHFVYEVRADPWRPNAGNMPGGDDGNPQIRFSIHGAHYLNWVGELYLADGDPGDTYEVLISRLPLAKRQPHWHWLAARCITGDRYTIPDFHSHLRAPVPGGIFVEYENGGTKGGLVPEPVLLAADRTLIVNTDYTGGIFQTGVYL